MPLKRKVNRFIKRGAIEGGQIHPDKPLEESARILRLTGVTGSIGKETFSRIPDLRHLNINRSKISHIEDGVFASKTNFHRLVLEDNDEFPVVTDGFLTCDSLRWLTLNRVEMEPGALKNLHNLTLLELCHQNNFNLTKDNLEPLKNLETLILDDCEIKHIENDALSVLPKLNSLTIKDINGIPVLTKSMFENCRNVTTLSFSSKYHVDVQDDALSQIPHLANVFFKYLNMKHLTQKFLSTLSNVGYLDISNSAFESIVADAFTGFNNMTHLFLKNNKLTHVNFGVGVDSLITLNLNGNMLTEISTEVVARLPKLSRLVLSNNKITSVDNIKHSELNHLFVDGNNISHIDVESLKQNLPNLSLLRIDNNPMSDEYVSELKTKLEEAKIATKE